MQIFQSCSVENSHEQKSSSACINVLLGKFFAAFRTRLQSRDLSRDAHFDGRRCNAALTAGITFLMRISWLTQSLPRRIVLPFLPSCPAASYAPHHFRRDECADCIEALIAYVREFQSHARGRIRPPRFLRAV